MWGPHPNPLGPPGRRPGPHSTATVPPVPTDQPSPWVARFAPMVPPGGAVLDLACGAGRHTRFFLERGHPVTAVDRDTSLLGDLTHPALTVLEEDLEDGRPFPLAGRRSPPWWCTRYLHRPLLPDLVAAVAPGGLFVYETFAAGQEAYGRPTNPDFLLNPGELLDLVRGELRVLAYEDLTVDEPAPSVIQRICARRAV